MKLHSNTLASLGVVLLAAFFCAAPQVASALDIPRPVQKMKQAKQAREAPQQETPATRSASSKSSREDARQPSRKTISIDIGAANGRPSNSGIPHWVYVTAAIVIGLVIVGCCPVAIFAVAPILVIILVYIAIRHFF